MKLLSVALLLAATVSIAHAESDSAFKGGSGRRGYRPRLIVHFTKAQRRSTMSADERMCEDWAKAHPITASRLWYAYDLRHGRH